MKRKSWRDRRCTHGRVPKWRVKVDLIHCSEAGCFEKALESAGLAPLKTIIFPDEENSGGVSEYVVGLTEQERREYDEAMERGVR